MSFQSDKNNLLNRLQSQPCAFNTIGVGGAGGVAAAGGVGTLAAVCMCA